MLPGDGIKALAALTSMTSVPAGTVVVATGEGRSGRFFGKRGCCTHLVERTYLNHLKLNMGICQYLWDTSEWVDEYPHQLSGCAQSLVPDLRSIASDIDKLII